MKPGLSSEPLVVIGAALAVIGSIAPLILICQQVAGKIKGRNNKEENC